MKLRNRFVMIIAGTFLVPFVIAVFSMLLFAPEIVHFAKNPYRDIQKFFAGIDSARTVEQIVEMAAEFQDDLFLLVLDGQGELVYARNEQGLTGIPDSEATQNAVLTKRVVLENGETVTVVMGTGKVPQFQSYVGIVVVGSLLIFLSLISMFTLRSINQSIHRLEEGTKRIAEGDLDTPFVFHGDDTFESLARSIDTMRQQVKEEYDRRTRFFMGVSHDLKTPLASITGYTDALLDGLADDAETRERYLRIIEAKGQLLEKRIAQLIEYVKITNKDFRSHLKRQPLVPFLEDFAALQADEAALLGYRFAYDITVDRQTVVSFDQDLLMRALENLLQNSYRYGVQDKPVRLLCQYGKEGGILLAVVNHHDAPIPSEMMRHIFEPFNRGDASRKGEGFGLGLASVKSIVESHGWHVEVRSFERECITMFQILIPPDPDNRFPELT